MKLAGATNKGLARRVRLLSETDGEGEPVRADHVAVKRWLDGTNRHPHPRTCKLIARVLGDLLGRVVSLEEIGYIDQTTTPDVGADYPEEVTQSVVALGAITDLELRMPNQVAHLTVVPEAWSGLVLRWLMDGDSESSRPPAEPRSITSMDVESVRAATQMFSTFDYKFGGGRPKSMVASFLDTEVMPLLSHVSPYDAV